VFFAPSDLSGIAGLRHERIRSVASWYGGPARRDCVYVGLSEDEGFRGLNIARVLLFFSFKYGREVLPCALVHWFSHVGDEPDDETGLWVVEPDLRSSKPFLQVIHLDTVLRGAHLIGNAGREFLPPLNKFNFSDSLNSFKSFYVNKYIDYCAHEMAF